MFLEAAVRFREDMRGRPPSQDALCLLLGCGVSRDDCPNGLAVLVAAALTGDRPETPPEPWMSEIQENFGQTVAGLVRTVTVRHGYREPAMRLAVLHAEGRAGALARILRAAQVTAKFSRTLSLLQRDGRLPKPVRQYGPTCDDVFGEEPFIVDLPPETIGFAPGFGRVVEIATNVRSGLLELLEHAEPVLA